MADFSLKDLETAFSNSLRSVFGGNSSPRPPTTGAPAATPAAGSGGGADTAGLNLNLNNLSGAFKKLLDNVAPVATAFAGFGAGSGKEMGAALQAIAQYAPLVGRQLGGLVTALEQGRTQLTTAAKFGAGGDNIAGSLALSKGAGYTDMGEMAQTYSKLGSAVTGVSGNMRQSSEALGRLARDVREQPLAKELLATANGAAALREAETIMAANTKTNLQAEGKERQNLINSTVALAQEIDMQSRMTGKSTDQIKAELQARATSAEGILSANLMNEGQRQAYMKTQASLNGMGPSIQGLAEKIASGARLNPQDMATMNALGPAASDFQRAIRMQQAATTEAQKQQADAALTAAKAKVNEWQSSERYARMALQGSGEIAEAQKRMITENQTRAGQQAVQRETGMTGTQAAQEQQRRASLEQQGRIGVGERRGQADEGQAVTRELNKAQEAARKNVAGLADNLDTLNRKAGSSATAVDNLNGALTKLFGGINESVGDKAIRGQKVAQKIVDVTGTGKGNVVTPGSKLDVEPGTRLKGRAVGSKDATGEWFENFGKGTPMMLHNKEAVVPQDKAPEFVKDFLAKMTGGNTQAPKMPEVKSMVSGNAPAPKMPDIKGMFGGMMDQMPGQVKSMMSQIKQPEFPKLPMIPNVASEIKKTSSATPQQPPTSTTAPAPKSPEAESSANSASGAADATLNDVVTALNQLNKTMGLVASSSEEIKEASSKTARLAGKATGNRALA